MCDAVARLFRILRRLLAPASTPGVAVSLPRRKRLFLSRGVTMDTLNAFGDSHACGVPDKHLSNQRVRAVPARLESDIVARPTIGQGKLRGSGPCTPQADRDSRRFDARPGTDKGPSNRVRARGGVSWYTRPVAWLRSAAAVRLYCPLRTISHELVHESVVKQSRRPVWL